MSEFYDYLLKVLLIGDTNVGKSSILLRFKDDRFVISQKQTIGIDLMTYLTKINENIIKLQIWDTAGQERFKSITSAYYKGCSIIIIVFDVTNRTSFENAKKWLREVNEQVNNNVLKVLLGNKIDMYNTREVSYEESNRFAEMNAILYYETSARNSIGVNEMFLQTANFATNKIIQDKLDNYKKYTEMNISFSQKILKKRNNICCL